MSPFIIVYFLKSFILPILLKRVFTSRLLIKDSAFWLELLHVKNINLVLSTLIKGPVMRLSYENLWISFYLAISKSKLLSLNSDFLRLWKN